MSHPSEMTCWLYAEGELPETTLRETEAHLVACRDCRVRIVALRDESALLGAVFREQRPASAPAAAPDPGVALGVPLAIAAVTIAIAAFGALLDSRLPGALDLLHPRRLKGAAEMAFDMIFLMRENAPGLVELAFSVGIVASLSAIGSFAVSALSRRIFDGAAILLLGALLFAPRPATAFVVHHDEDVRSPTATRTGSGCDSAPAPTPETPYPSMATTSPSPSTLPPEWPAPPTPDRCSSPTRSSRTSMASRRSRSAPTA